MRHLVISIEASRNNNGGNGINGGNGVAKTAAINGGVKYRKAKIAKSAMKAKIKRNGAAAAYVKRRRRKNRWESENGIEENRHGEISGVNGWRGCGEMQ